MRYCNQFSCGSNARKLRVGFTLIELLIVIVIIGLLAAASMVALGGARGFFRNTTAKMQLDDVSRGLELYKQKFGEYPPDCCATDSEIRRHILKRWPKALKSGNISAMIAFARGEMTKTPGSAALFWLAGPGDDAGDSGIVYDGFLSDPTNPFGLNSDGTRMAYADIADEPTEAPLIELKYDSEGKDGNYNENGFIFNGQVMGYFRANQKSYEGKMFCWGDTGDCVPYMKNGRWYNNDSYQLILPGEDGMYGEFEGHDHEEEEFEIHDVADSETMALEEWDNITNFTEGATLDSERQ